MSAAARAVLSLGSNLGDREATLAQALRDIAAIDEVELGAVSSIVETAAIKPHGVDANAPAYLNLVAEVTTTLAPHALLAALGDIERDHGRTREVRWGDRTLDIDIIAIDDLELESDTLTVPHPRAAERAFVLVPWLEIDPDAALPGVGPIGRLSASHEVVARYRAEADS